jgi:hypothetical protein
MGDLSASVRLKLDRAKEHAETMERLVLDWEGEHTERFVPEIDHEATAADFWANK